MTARDARREQSQSSSPHRALTHTHTHAHHTSPPLARLCPAQATVLARTSPAATTRIFHLTPQQRQPPAHPPHNFLDHPGIVKCKPCLCRRCLGGSVSTHRHLSTRRGQRPSTLAPTSKLALQRRRRCRPRHPHRRRRRRRLPAHHFLSSSVAVSSSGDGSGPCTKLLRVGAALLLSSPLPLRAASHLPSAATHQHQRGRRSCHRPTATTRRRQQSSS